MVVIISRFHMRYEDYKTIRDIALKYYKDNNMCTVISLAVAAGCGYGKAFHTFRRLGRKTGKGTRFPVQVAAFLEHGLRLEGVRLGAATVCTAEKLLSSTLGMYLVYSTGHVSAVYDGKMYDWAAGGSRKRVNGIFKVIPIN